MTNLEQRAEETAEWIATCNLQNGPIIVPFMKEKILLALRQTREEALKEAVKIADSLYTYTPHLIAKRIRALASESEE